MKSKTVMLALVIAAIGTPAFADFFGPSAARRATSPNGEMIVRIHSSEPKEPDARAKHELIYYQFDSSRDSYTRRSSFELDGLPMLLFLSDSGDLVMVALGHSDAVRLFSKDGKLVQSWDLDDFLTEDEIEACSQTGSTLQWFDEGAFHDRVFHFRGPAQRIRALTPPYTVMREANSEVTFSALIESATSKLKKLDGQPVPDVEEKAGAREADAREAAAAREPKWLPVRDLLADSFSIEYQFTSDNDDGNKPSVKVVRKSTVVCLRAVVPQHEQVKEIAAAIPGLDPNNSERSGPPGNSAPPEYFNVVDYTIERQELNEGDSPDWEKVSWKAVPAEKSLELLYGAYDFDAEVIDSSESNPEFTFPLPKLVKGRWDNRVTHPGLREDKLPEAKLTKGGARYALFRYFDLSVEPGHTYRYRIKLIYKNPATYSDKKLPRKIRGGEHRESPWSAPSPPVGVGTKVK
jgi:hypothetical protein